LIEHEMDFAVEVNIDHDEPHKGIFCSYCSQLIKSERLFCVRCDNVNSCKECESKLIDHCESIFPVHERSMLRDSKK